MHEVLPSLGRTLSARASEMPPGSYTAELLREGPKRIGAKVSEEAAEVAQAAREQSPERVREEAADVLYHLGVLLQARGLEFSDALEELSGRMSAREKRPTG